METAVASPVVLVVEDHKDTREFFEHVLRKSLQVETVGAEDGWTAIALAEERRPAVVVLDLDLPGMDGIEAARHLRRDGEPTNPRIVVVSCLATERHRSAARAAGCDHFLAKPCAPEVITEVVRRYVGRNAPSMAR